MSERDQPPLHTEQWIDWDKRLEIESPLLERVLSEAPSDRVIDLGCGAGQHARLLAKLGADVVAIDASEDVILRAQESLDEEAIDRIQYILTDMGAVERSVHGHFGAAFCLGNTLAQLLSPESVSRMLIGLKRRLRPGAPLLIQGLNYDRIFATGERTLATQFVPQATGELVVVRMVQARPDGIVVHTTTALHHQPREHPVMSLVGSRANQWRGWRLPELETMLDVARLPIREIWGDMAGTPFDPETSEELVILAG